jgi:apolipoprotein N-acyltransferase
VRLHTILFAWILPAVSGALMAFALPPFNYSEAGWVALVPLLFALEDCGRGEAFRRGYFTGLVFFGMTIWWTIHVTLPGMVALVAFLSLYFGMAAAFFSVAANRLRARDSFLRNLLLAVIGTAWWVTLEWVRGKFLFGGFGWNGIGVSQHQTLPLIQIASITGVYGVSALLVLGNFAIYFTARRFLYQPREQMTARRLSWELYAVVALMCGVFMFGIHEIRKSDGKARGLRVALVQGNIPQSLKFDPREKLMILERYRVLSERAALLKPELVIWPETAMPGALRYEMDSYSLATNVAAKAGAPLLTGTMDVTPGSNPSEWFNAAVLMQPDGRLTGLYRKIHLVAFGEYVPLRKIVPVFKWLTPIDGSFERGHTYDVFQVNGFRFGTVICFEDTLPDLYRRFVQRGVDFMVNLTNDGWFKDSPAAEMHLANAVFRAVETRRPLVRCTNNGVTCIVDEYGHVNPNKRLPLREEGMLVCELPVPYHLPMTPYVEYGDWFIAVCALISATAGGWFAWQSRKRA